MPRSVTRPHAAAALAALVVLLLAPRGAAPAVAPDAPAMPPMATCVPGLLRKGDRWTPERSARVDSLQAGHMANMRRMWEAGRRVLAGPVDGAGEIARVSIYATDSLAAWNAANADPAVASGRMRVEMVRLWPAYGNLPGERAGLAEGP